MSNYEILFMKNPYKNFLLQLKPWLNASFLSSYNRFAFLCLEREREREFNFIVFFIKTYWSRSNQALYIYSYKYYKHHNITSKIFRYLYILIIKMSCYKLMQIFIFVFFIPRVCSQDAPRIMPGEEVLWHFYNPC